MCFTVILQPKSNIKDMNKDIHTRKTARPAISQREFARIWNMLLSKIRKEVKRKDNLPSIILTMDKTDSMVHNTLFVMERLDADIEFKTEMRNRFGVDVMLTYEQWNNFIIKIIKK